MSTEQKPVLAQGTPAATPALDPNMLYSLIQLLLTERQDALLEKKDKQRVVQAREDQSRLNSQYNEAEQKTRESMCTHKKGGRKGPKSAKLDYAVYFHTFVDASSYIRCLICGAKWKPRDTKEFLVRKGKQVENHTGIGWKEAHEMLANSTNTPSASEVLLSASPIAAMIEPQDFSKNPHAVEI